MFGRKCLNKNFFDLFTPCLWKFFFSTSVLIFVQGVCYKGFIGLPSTNSSFFDFFKIVIVETMLISLLIFYLGKRSNLSIGVQVFLIMGLLIFRIIDTNTSGYVLLQYPFLSIAFLIIVITLSIILIIYNLDFGVHRVLIALTLLFGSVSYTLKISTKKESMNSIRGGGYYSTLTSL